MGKPKGARLQTLFGASEKFHETLLIIATFCFDNLLYCISCEAHKNIKPTPEDMLGGAKIFLHRNSFQQESIFALKLRAVIFNLWSANPWGSADYG